MIYINFSYIIFLLIQQFNEQNLDNKSLLILLSIFNLKAKNDDNLDTSNNFELLNEKANDDETDVEKKHSFYLMSETKIDHIINRVDLQTLLEQNQHSVTKLPFAFEVYETMNEESRSNYSQLLESWNLFRNTIIENEFLAKVNVY